MSIWFKKEISVAGLTDLGKGTMIEHIGIEWTEIGDNYLKARMPVDHRTVQPYGILHGGASCVLAETMGSVASSLVIDTGRFHCAGLEINANHIRMAREGFVTGIVSPVHLGTTTHIWDIKIYDGNEKLICISRLTVAIITMRTH